MAITTRSSFNKQLIPGILKALFGLTMEAQEPTQILSKNFFKIIPSTRAFEEFSSNVGLGLFADKPEGAGVTLDEVREDLNILVSSRSFGKGCLLTIESEMDSQYSQALEKSKSLADSAGRTLETLAATFLTEIDTALYATGDAFATTIITAANGETWGNLAPIPTSVSEAGLIQDVVNISFYRDARGNLMAPKIEVATTSVETGFVFRKILLSTLEPASANNAINIATSAIIPGGVKESQYLRGPRYYFRTNIPGLIQIQRMAPELRTDQDKLSYNLVFSSMFRTRFTLYDQRGIYVNQGA